MPLIVRAGITFIGNANEYYVSPLSIPIDFPRLILIISQIQWNIENIPADFKNILALKGPVLTIPPYTLRSGQKYVIEADLMDASNSKPVAKTNHTVDIALTELRVSIIPVNALIGVGRSIDIELNIQDYNINKGRMSVSGI